MALIEEIESLKQIRHNALLGYIGTELEENSESCVLRIFEEYASGNFLSNLKKSGNKNNNNNNNRDNTNASNPKQQNMDEVLLRKCARQLLIGLAFLHTINKPHRLETNSFRKPKFSFIFFFVLMLGISQLATSY